MWSYTFKQIGFVEKLFHATEWLNVNNPQWSLRNWGRMNNRQLQPIVGWTTSQYIAVYLLLSSILLFKDPETSSGWRSIQKCLFVRHAEFISASLCHFLIMPNEKLGCTSQWRNITWKRKNDEAICPKSPIIYCSDNFWKIKFTLLLLFSLWLHFNPWFALLIHFSADPK